MDAPDPVLLDDHRGPRLDRYAGAIEHDIVPRLLHATRAGPLPPHLLFELGAHLAERRVAEFVGLIRGNDDGAGGRYVEALLEEGVTSEAVYLDLLAPAARLLGRMWEEDTCDFMEVSLSLGRLQRTLRSLSHLFLAGSGPGAAPSAGCVLLTCVAGEQHTLGLLMVAEFFVREGWDVELGHPVDIAGLSAIVRGQWFDVVGFSVACDSSLGALRRDVAAVRRNSLNRGVGVMVGGRVFDQQPGLVRRVGADATAANAADAPRVAASLR
ncbi:MAG TPA: cobalamin B12-binding domain-containing protein [Longimicrobium sp.]|nr:cobalamin B12-binding domain-containing protein [Longimicrobium sp.]